MRKLSTLVGLAFFGLLLVGCEGPQGPQGPEGPAGADGADGADGINAAETCTDCHVDDTRIFARQTQYQNSIHYLGGNFERGGNAYDATANSCAKCHSHEGFRDFLATGTTSWTPAFDNPSPVNCRTCHEIHTSYTQTDWQLSSTTPVTADWDGSTLDLGDVGNLCVNCHQARPVSPMPVVDGANVTFTSSRYGPHHSNQGQLISGTGLFEFGNVTVTGGPSAHGNGLGTNPGVCAGCHMAPAFGNKAGGHTWRMEYLYHGATEDFVQGCQECHSTISDFDFGGVHDCVADAETALGTYLENTPNPSPNGIKRPGEELANQNVSYPANLVAGYLNYLLIESDQSHGLHNPAYALEVLADTFAEFGLATPASCVALW